MSLCTQGGGRRASRRLVGSVSKSSAPESTQNTSQATHTDTIKLDGRHNRVVQVATELVTLTILRSDYGFIRSATQHISSKVTSMFNIVI